MGIFSGFGNSNASDANYTARLKQWLADNERITSENELSKLAPIIQQMQANYTQSGQIPPQTQMSLDMINSIAHSGAGSSLASVLKMLEAQQGDFSQGGTPTDVIKNANDMGLTGPARAAFIYQSALKPTTSINMNSGGADRVNWATPDEIAKAGFAPGTAAVVTKAGGIEPIKAPDNESETKLRANLDMMNNVERRMQRFEKSFPAYDPSNYKSSFLRSLGNVDNFLASYASEASASEADKAYNNMAREWVAASRSQLSGAAVPEVEFRRDMYLYFASPNDTPAIRNLKAEMRRDRLNSLAQAAQLPPDKRVELLSQINSRNEMRLIDAQETEALGPQFTKMLDGYKKQLGRELTPQEMDEAKADWADFVKSQAGKQ